MFLTFASGTVSECARQLAFRARNLKRNIGKRRFDVFRAEELAASSAANSCCNTRRSFQDFDPIGKSQRSQTVNGQLNENICVNGDAGSFMHGALVFAAAAAAEAARGDFGALT